MTTVYSEFDQKIFHDPPPPKIKTIQSYQGKSLNLNIPGAKTRSGLTNNISYLKEHYNVGNAAKVRFTKESTQQYLLNLALEQLNEYTQAHDQPEIRSITTQELYNYIVNLDNHSQNLDKYLRTINSRSPESFQLKNNKDEIYILLLKLNDIYKDYYKLQMDLKRLNAIGKANNNSNKNKNKNNASSVATEERNTNGIFGNLEGGRSRRRNKTKRK